MNHHRSTVPSTPHTSIHALVFLIAALVTLVATLVAMRMPGYPGGLLGWPKTFGRRVYAGFRSSNRETAYWTAIGVFAVVVTVLHFGGIRYDVYTTLHWWDLLTHALSGLGVAALLYLTFHRPTPDRRPLGWLVPAVLAFGAGFEVYEFVVKDFWYTWTFQFYLVDTLVDLVAGVAGAVAFVVLLGGYRAIARR